MRRLMLAALALACMPNNPAAAHAFGQRYDLPIPLLLYLIAAAAVVALSFVAAALFLRGRGGQSRDDSRRAWPPIRGAVVFVPLWRALSLAALIFVVVAGLFGVQDTYRNPAPLAVWVVGWVALSLVSGLCGDIWRIINPFAGIADAFAWLFGRSWGPLLPYPDGLGAWPGVVLFVGFAWSELLWEGSGHPDEVAGLLTLYVAFTLLGMAVFGRAAWLRGGEIFGIAFGLFAGFAPVEISRSGRHWRLRPFGAGLLPRLPFPPSRAAFLLTMLGVLAFDGLSETPDWLALIRALRPGEAATDLALLALVLVPALFATVFVAAVILCRWAGGGPGLIALIGWFAPALVPIALGYHLAHNLAFLLLGLQYLIPVLSDPFGMDWDLFGTRLYMVDLSVLNAAMLWYVAVGAIVIGHVAAVCLAHIVALRVFPSRIAALRSQLPMLVLMIGYTMSSLWLLAQPITNARTGG